VLRQLHSDLWIADAPLRFFGVEMGTRMTVVRLPDTRLFVHSPVAATAGLVGEVRALGTVAALVAPNRFHHLFVRDWQRAFPDAAVYVAPGLEKKRPDLTGVSTLADAPEPAWAGTIEQVRFEGFSLMNEVVFFHRPSATLIVSDLAFNIGAESPPLTRFLFRLIGAYERLGPTFVERLAVRDRPAFARSLSRVLAWPFERIVVAHGQVCERGCKEALAQSYSWVLAGGSAAR
jgi:hypothetical protein